MENVIETIKQAKSVAVMAHISEDPDAIGSCLAMAHVLEMMGKNAVCYFSEAIDKTFDFLHPNYKVYPTGQEILHDLCIVLDCGDLDRLGERTELFTKAERTVNIDHHYTNPGFADANYIDADASSTGEMLWRLFQKMHVPIDVDTARYLYLAIAADTGSFQYSNVSPETMRVAADLLEQPIDHARIAKALFGTESLCMMRLKADIMGHIQSFYDGKLALVTVEEKQLQKYGVEERTTGSLVNIPRRVEGTQIAVCLKEKDGKVKLSMRSGGEVNVAEIAAQFSGGGHKMAAGGILDCSLKEAVDRVVKACRAYIG